MQNRKLKTFYVMKPNIIKDIKQKLLEEKLESNKVKRLCKATIAHLHLASSLKIIWANYSYKKANRAR